MSFLVACRSCRLSVRIARRIVLTFSECSLSYAKMMQTSGKRACSWFPECRLSYAKITYFTLTSVQTFLFLLCAMRGGTHVRRNPLIAHNAEMNIYAPFQVIVFYRMKTRNRSACDCLIRLCIWVWSLDGRSISAKTTSSGTQLMAFIWLFKC